MKAKYFLWLLLFLNISAFGQYDKGGLKQVGSVAVMQLDTNAREIIRIIENERIAGGGSAFTFSERYYVNYIVTNLKAIGVWQKCKAIYGFVGGTAASHKWNWKDMRDLDEAFRLKQGQFSTITTIDDNLGVSFAGTYNYLQTSIFPTTVGLTKDNFHLSIYNRTGSDFSYEIGNVLTSNGSLSLGVNRGGSTVAIPAGTAAIFTSTISPNSLIILNSTSSTKVDIYGKGILKSSYLESRIGALDNNEITLGTLGNLSTPSFESSKQIQFASVGSGLTDQQAIQMSNSVTYAQGFLNRQ